MSFDAEYFEGHKPRRCGEHRTVGPHRAWCDDCSEWCYPSSGCAGCGPTREELEERVERYRLAWLSARRRAAA